MKYGQDKFSEYYGSADYRKAYEQIDWSDTLEEVETTTLDNGWRVVLYKDNKVDLFIVRCAGQKLQTFNKSRTKAMAAMVEALNG